MANQPYDWRKFDGPQFFTRVPVADGGGINLHEPFPLSALKLDKKPNPKSAAFYTFFLNEKHTSHGKRLWVASIRTSKS